VVAEELQSAAFFTENGKRSKTSKLRLLIKQIVNLAISGKLQPFVHMIKNQDTFERLTKLPVKSIQHRFSDEDIEKMSLDEKIKKFQEIIANTKPLDEYQ
jgi:hypothetical protein